MKKSHGKLTFKKRLRRWGNWFNNLFNRVDPYGGGATGQVGAHAAGDGKTEEMLSLLKQKIPDLPDEARLGKCLFAAAGGGHVETVRALLDLGAEPRYQLLLYVAHKGHTEVVKLLLQYGVDMEEKDRQGRTALLGAVGIPCYPMEYKEPGQPKPPELAELMDWESPLWDEWDECKSHFTTVSVLVAHGADIHACNSYGYTALMGAAYHGDLDSLRLLLDAGADINARDLAGLTALSYATEQEQKKAIQLLQEYGARP